MKYEKSKKVIIALLVVAVFVFALFGIVVSNATDKYTFPTNPATIMKQIKAVSKNGFSFSLNQKQMDKINAILETQSATEYRSEGEILEKVDPKFFNSLPMIVREDLYHMPLQLPPNQVKNSSSSASLSENEYLRGRGNVGMRFQGSTPVGAFGEAIGESGPSSAGVYYTSADANLYKYEEDGHYHEIASKYALKPFSHSVTAHAQSSSTTMTYYDEMGTVSCLFFDGLHYSLPANCPPTYISY